MKVLEPSVNRILEIDPMHHIATCARVCYQSKAKTEDSDAKLVKWLQDHHHLSMLRHSTHYYKVPIAHLSSPSNQGELAYWIFDVASTSPYCDTTANEEYVWIVINGQTYYELEKVISDALTIHEVTPDDFRADGKKSMIRYTFELTTQISTSRELNRRSPNNIAEMSTRYVMFSDEKTVEPAIVRPHWISREDANTWLSYDYDSYDTKEFMYLSSCNGHFFEYISLINAGVPHEDARGILPLDTMTKVIYTYSESEWRYMIDMRVHGTTGRPHPNAKLIMSLVENQLNAIDELYK